MRRFWLTFSFCILLLGTGAALSTVKADTAPAPTLGKTTQVITDEKNHVVRILIDGKQVVLIDAAGMHVNGSIDYTGTMRDTNGR